MDWRYHPEMVRAAQLVAADGVVACPTEAVWGLSCDARSEVAVRRLLAIKQRPQEKGLILIVDHIDRLQPYVTDMGSPSLERLATCSIGYPVTWLIPHNGTVPKYITGEHRRLAVRVTAHPPTAALCELLAAPLVSTSANPSGAPAATSESGVIAYFGDRVDAIVPGPLGSATGPSEIRDLVTGDIIREG
jgi:L-threonylcarbamoyladenylate synthase